MSEPKVNWVRSGFPSPDFIDGWKLRPGDSLSVTPPGWNRRRLFSFQFEHIRPPARRPNARFSSEDRSGANDLELADQLEKRGQFGLILRSNPVE
jgi:hypothetical protein